MAALGTLTRSVTVELVVEVELTPSQATAPLSRVLDQPDAGLQSRDVPRTWHEAWLDTADARGRVDVIVPAIGAWPTMCDDRHPWLLQTQRGTRPKTTTCTRRSGHTGRHSATTLHARHAATGPVHRVVAVWEYPS